MLEAATRFVLEDPFGKRRAESAEPSSLTALRAACRIEHRPGAMSRCMCNGDLTVMLFQGSRKLGEVTNHHGNTVRFTQGASDGTLLDGAAWRAWLTAHGAPEVETQWKERTRLQTIAVDPVSAWTTAMPSSLRSFWDEMLVASRRNELAPSTVTLREALTAEVSDTREQITALLFWLGAGGRDWFGYPKYEDHPLALLPLWPMTEIVAVCEASEDSQLVAGAARFFAVREKVPFRFPYDLKFKFWHRVKDCHIEENLKLARKVFKL
ncbi:MAG: hypothetical protein QM817_38315 [Archangium sp.]